MWSTGRNTDEKFSWQIKPGGVHRTQSLGAGDSVTTPPSHRRHRMQYLANRSLFERTAPSELPPLPPVLPRPSLTKQQSFTHFANELLNKQESVYEVDGSLPPLKIVEEPICTRKHVYRTSSNVVNNIDSWQPKWLHDDNKADGTDKERKVNIKRSNSDAISRSMYKPRDVQQSRMQQQYAPPSKYTMGKTVRDLADAYQTVASEKSKPPMLARRSSMSATPVKVLARRFSIPNK